MSGKSPLGNSREPGSYEGLNVVVPVGGWQLIKARRIPTTNDIRYPVGSIWVDTVTQASYQLVAAPGIWVALGISSGPLNTLTGDAGGAIAPGAGNITLAGTANQIATTGAGSTITFSIPATFTAPGSITATTSIASGTTITAGTALIATTSVTAGTTITATLGDITATNGDLVLGTAGNKILSTSVGAAAAAGANSFGTVTLIGGTITVSTTAVTASSIIILTRQSVGATGANDLGILSVGTIVAATSFVINSWTVTNATALQTDDVSVIGWFIIN